MYFDSQNFLTLPCDFSPLGMPDGPTDNKSPPRGEEEGGGGSGSPKNDEEYPPVIEDTG